LVQKIEWGLANREQLYEMGQAAAWKARASTWAKFREGVIDAYRHIIESIPGSSNPSFC
jgi:hypothetical protein